MSNLENVFYINLEHREDRKKLVEEELNALGWKYERFNAIKMKPGSIGCSMSHLKILTMAKERDLDYVVIVEDDIQFTNKPIFTEIFNNFISTKTNFDVLLLAGNVRELGPQVNKYSWRIHRCFTTTGYIVKKHYYDTLIENIREGIPKLMREPEKHYFYAIDSNWMKLQKRDNWLILMPRTITQRPDYSDIEEKEINYNHVMLDKIKVNDNKKLNMLFYK
jgi:glycosyl transferase family 25